jgi:hypothetical protein
MDILLMYLLRVFTLELSRFVDYPPGEGETLAKKIFYNDNKWTGYVHGK